MSLTRRHVRTIWLNLPEPCDRRAKDGEYGANHGNECLLFQHENVRAAAVS